MTNIGLALGNTLLFVLVIIEIILIKQVKKEELPWKELIMNLNSGHILMWIFRGLEVTVYYYVFQFNIGLVDELPYWTVWIIAFIVWDFFFYWLHRLHHHLSLLWNVHVVHHEGEHFSLSLGIRNSWYSSITSIPFFLLMAIAGIPVEIFLAVSSIHYFIQFYNHNHLVNKSGWLEYVMITPSHHRVHHGKNHPYLHRNFGGTFVFWDKMFGTFQAELDGHPVAFGIDEPVRSYNPVWSNNIPFFSGLRRALPSYQKGATVNVPNTQLITGGALLFTLLLTFIYWEEVFSLPQKIVAFSIIFSGTIANGLQADAHKMGSGALFFSSLVLPVFFLCLNTLSYHSFIVALCIYFLYGCICLFLPRVFKPVELKRLQT